MQTIINLNVNYYLDPRRCDFNRVLGEVQVNDFKFNIRRCERDT